MLYLSQKTAGWCCVLTLRSYTRPLSPLKLREDTNLGRIPATRKKVLRNIARREGALATRGSGLGNHSLGKANGPKFIDQLFESQESNRLAFLKYYQLPLESDLFQFNITEDDLRAIQAPEELRAILTARMASRGEINQMVKRAYIVESRAHERDCGSIEVQSKLFFRNSLEPIHDVLLD